MRRDKRPARGQKLLARLEYFRRTRIQLPNPSNTERTVEHARLPSENQLSLLRSRDLLNPPREPGQGVPRRPHFLIQGPLRVPLDRSDLYGRDNRLPKFESPGT